MAGSRLNTDNISKSMYKVNSSLDEIITLTQEAEMCIETYSLGPPLVSKMKNVHFSMLVIMTYFCLPYPTVSGGKMALKIGNFHNFMIFENLSISLAKIPVTEFPKSKI